MKLLLKIVLHIAIIGSSSIAHSQVVLDIDSIGVDTGENWSLRFFAGQKYLNFSLYDANLRQSMHFSPGNPGNIGIGYAYKFLMIDLAMRPKLDSESPTSRFDIQSYLLVNHHFVDIVFQKYTGFDSELGEQNLFREDISMLQTGINYLYLKNEEVANFSQLKKGYSTKRNMGSFAIGGFGHLNVMKSDSAISSTLDGAFFDQELRNIKNWSFGMSVGYFYRCHIGDHLFLSLGAVPGISLNLLEREGNENKTNRLHPGALVQVKTALGYLASRHYLVMTYNTQQNFVLLKDNHRYQYALGFLRIAYGFKFQSSNPLNKVVDRLTGGIL